MDQAISELREGIPLGRVDARLMIRNAAGACLPQARCWNWEAPPVAILSMGIGRRPWAGTARAPMGAEQVVGRAEGGRAAAKAR